ncbi:MAG: hypothetical protein M1833_007055 [Piccolia ochrophora]|nr:MAG: hypothetical protein M1833_007055 [Piccolia ochrophora]
MSASAHRIAIVGAGSVGAAIANALLYRRVAGHIVFTDIDAARLHAQAQDLSDAAFLSNARIHEGTARDAGQCDIIVISAGAKQRPEDTRLALVQRNYEMLRSVLGDMKPIRPDAILVLVANPVDVLTFFAQKLSGLPKAQVLGSGTFLDSTRLRSMLATKAQVADTAVHAYVLGEHGDSQFVAWSSVTIGCTPLSTVLPLTADERSAIATAAKDKALEIIKVKGFTSYGVAAIVTSICESILFDQRHVRPLSHWQEELQCCLSLPAVLGRNGIARTVELPLSEEEESLLQASASTMKDVIKSCETEPV